MKINKHKAICNACQKVVLPGEGVVYLVQGPFSRIYLARHSKCRKEDMKHFKMKSSER